MPFEWIDSKTERLCSAKAKSTSQRCLNPAAYGCHTCRLHGARKPNSIKRGTNHPNYRHGMETLSAKQERSTKLAKLREIEDELILRGLVKGKKNVGRKPW